jgi:hypothetical protein
VSFRFAFLYWIIYLLPSSAMSPIHALAPWVGQHVFHLKGEGANWHPTGSGDTALDYVVAAIGLVAALAGALLWSVVSEVRGGRKEYRTAYAWLRLLLRFALAVTLLDYGFIKIFPAQFGPLSPYGLTETYGDSSPMHLLWTFMGQSRSYMMFGGLMEAIPGVLMLFRRTSTVGLLGASAVLANVVMLNFSYDVAVKLYSVHLLLIALFLLLPDAQPIWRFLAERKEASLTGVWVPRFERKPLRVGAHVLQGLVVVVALYMVVSSSYEQAAMRANVGPIQGVYEVKRASGFGEDAHWIQVFFDDRYGQHYLGLIGADKNPQRFAVAYDLKSQTMRLTDKDSPATFHWNEGADGELTLMGTFKGSPTSMDLQRTSPKTFALNSRGFHWVTEQSYNH